MLPTSSTDQLCRYFTSVFVSLGVFLFGYDQGVMSGIITSVFPFFFYGTEGFADTRSEAGISRITSINPRELQ